MSAPARSADRQQSLYREVNERITELAGAFDLGDPMEIFCECGVAGCTERISLSERDYERLRLIPTHFAVVAGHEVPSVERVAEAHTGYLVVEKVGESAVTAINLDPRRSRPS